MAKFNIRPWIKKKINGSKQTEQIMPQTVIPAVIGLEKILNDLRSKAGGKDTFDKVLTFIKKNYLDKTEAMDLFSRQDVLGQKDFAQYPTINHGETLYPASSTGWVAYHNIKFGPNFYTDGPNADYAFQMRIDTINGNSTIHIAGWIKVHSGINNAKKNSDESVFIYLPDGFKWNPIVSAQDIDNRTFKFGFNPNNPSSIQAYKNKSDGFRKL